METFEIADCVAQLRMAQASTYFTDSRFLVDQTGCIAGTATGVGYQEMMDFRGCPG